MKKSSIYSVLCVVLAFSFIISSSAMTVNAWKISTNAINSVSIGSVSGKITEEYEPDKKVYPGEQVAKVVQVENTGRLDAFVRVKVSKVWGDCRDDAGKLIPLSLSTDNIVIDFNTDDWYYNSEDGFYYYKQVLTPSRLSTPLFQSFTLDEKTGNEYKNKQADIVVTTELVQACGDGLSFWNMTQSELGILYSESEIESSVTSVSFKNPSDGFNINADSGDLFVNFKSLAPAESRTQEITITNDWTNTIEVFLSGRENEQLHASSTDKALLDKLLKEYVHITITKQDGGLVYSGTVWGNVDSDEGNPYSMGEPFSLGELAPKQTSRLYVSLSVDKSLDNSYKNLLGKVEWVFTAQGEDNISTTDTDSTDTTTDISTDTDSTDTATDISTDTDSTDTATDISTDTDSTDTATDISTDTDSTDTATDISTDTDSTDTATDISTDTDSTDTAKGTHGDKSTDSNQVTLNSANTVIKVETVYKDAVTTGYKSNVIRWGVLAFMSAAVFFILMTKNRKYND